VPGESLFIDGAGHDEDETEGGKLGQHAKSHAQTSGKFGDAEEDSESFTHLDALGARCGIFEMALAASDEDQANHHPHEQQAEIGEKRELREHDRFLR
jgi:hypothetical protein